MCYSGHHLMVSGHFNCWVAGSFKFRFCGELNVAVCAVCMRSETIHVVLMYLHKRIVHISEPHRGGLDADDNAIFSKFSM